MPTLTKLYSMKEAAQHNSKDDCWVVIDGKVYDVSSYMDEHPGGDNVLLAATGKDATGEFEDVGHSMNAREHMENFFIGELDTFTPHIEEEEEEEEESTGHSKRRTEIVEKLEQHWAVPVAVVGISVVVTFLYLHRRK